MTDFPGTFLDRAGLNRQHVFELAALPEDIRSGIAAQRGETQLILLGHGGRRLWECVQAAGTGGEHPIDDYCIRTVADWFAACLPGRRYRLLYPGDAPVGLQALGRLAGWHHASPFMVGIDADWGSWYAYRAVLVADTDFAPSPVVDRGSPCLDCRQMPCIAACPAGALNGGRFDLDACSDWRLAAHSRCAEGCLARTACPVGAEHRYADAQIAHSYRQSLAMLRAWREAQPTGLTPPSATQPRTTR